MNGARAQLAVQLLEDRFTPLLAHLVLFGLLAILLAGTVPSDVLAGWGGAVLAVSLGRVATWQWLRRQPRKVDLSTVARGMMLALGLVWGLGTAIALHSMPLADMGPVLLGLTGLLAGGLSTLSADRWVFPIYALAMFVPVAIACALLETAPYSDVGVALIVIYLVFTIRLHARSYTTLLQRLSAEDTQRVLLRELQASVAEVRVLRGILPICASCKRIRGEDGTWEAVESYVREHTEAEFSHGLCPDCAKRDWNAP